MLSGSSCFQLTLRITRTLAIPVASTIFFELGEPGRAEMGISPGLVRLSVGIEDIRDVIADFAQALSRSGTR